MKESHPNLYEDVERLFADLKESQDQAYPFDDHKTANQSHECIEIRKGDTMSEA